MVWTALGALSVAFHLWLVFAGLVPNLVSRPLHMALAIPWVLLWRPGGGRAGVFAWLMATLGIAACIYVAWNESRLGDQYGQLSGPLQLALAIILLGCAIEMARRSVGWPLPSLAVIALLYGLFGQHLPGEFGHAGTPVDSFLGTLTIAEGGL
jgi:TRAP-type uncharacterized transport system fused permease subunit